MTSADERASPAESGPSAARRLGIVALYVTSIVSLAAAPLLMPAGYSWVEHTTSESAAQGLDGAWLARIGFLAFGFAVISSALTLRWWGAAARATHVAFGACMIAVAAFSSRPADPTLPYVELEDLLHSALATAMGFAFAIGVAIVGWRRTRSGGRPTLLDIVAVAASVAIPLAMWAWGDWPGLAQRLMFAIAFAWYLKETLTARVGVAHDVVTWSRGVLPAR